jgi:hypothetical protein
MRVNSPQSITTPSLKDRALEAYQQALLEEKNMPTLYL